MKARNIRLHPPLIAMLATTAMIGWLNGAALGPFLPQIAADLNTTVPALGQVTSILFFLAAGVSLIVGPIADARGTRRLLLGGLLAVVVCSVGTALATSYWLLLVVRLAGAFSAGTLAGISLAVAATMFDGDERRRAIGWVIAGISGGAIAGIPLLTLAGGLGGWRIAFISIAGVALIVAALLRTALPDDAKREPINLGAVFQAYVPLARSSDMTALYAASGLRAVGWMGFLVYAGSFFQAEFGLSVQEVGATYTIGGLGYFLGTTLAGGRMGGRPLRSIFVATTFLNGIGVGAMLALPVGIYTCVGLMTVAAFLLAISGVCLSTLLATETPAGQATTMALNAGVIELGTGVGGAAGGALIALGSYPTLGFGLMLFSMLSALLLYGRPATSQRTAVPSTSAG